jgi:hypothetical protein
LRALSKAIYLPYKFKNRYLIFFKSSISLIYIFFQNTIGWLIFIFSTLVNTLEN